MDKRQEVLARFAILAGVGFGAFTAFLWLFHLVASLVVVGVLAIALAGTSMVLFRQPWIYEEESLDTRLEPSQTQHQTRQVREARMRLPYGGSAWAAEEEAKRLGRSDSESESTPQADQRATHQ